MDIVILAGLVGAAVGFGADRLSARWPAHADGGVRPMDWRTVVVVLAGAVSLGALAARWDDPTDLIILGIYVAALIVLLATDLDQRLLPDRITYPLVPYAAAVTFLGLNPVLADKQQFLIAPGDLSAILAVILVPGGLYVSDRIFKGSLGMGDLKLSVSLALLFGIGQLFIGLLVGTVAFAAVLVVLLAGRRVALKQAVPFGPALICAGVVAALL